MVSFSEAAIRQRASAQSWTRGVNYFNAGRVVRAVLRGTTYTAQVQGSEYEPYRVTVTLTPDGAIADATCTCPYNWGGDCKHIVAALLYLLHCPEEVEKRLPLEDLLEGLTREQLVQVVLELARLYPDDVADLVDDLARTPIVQVPLSPEAESEPMPNLAELAHQIKRDLRTRVQTFYAAYYEGWESEDAALSEALWPAVESAGELLEANSPRAALAVLETATEAWIEGCERTTLPLKDVSEEIAQEEAMLFFGHLWAKALLMADLTPAERAEWAKRLEAWHKEMVGGEALKMAITAAEQGWDYPPLVAAMQGHITEQGAWEGKAPYFADDLARIRLEILERQGRVEEYLNLAQAEGQHHLYVYKLVELGKYDLAAREARKLLVYASQILAVAQALWEHGQTELALALGEHGLQVEAQSSFPYRQSGELAAWVRDRAEEAGRLDLARRAAWKALEASPTADNYRQLAELHGDEWPAHREKALALVQKGTSDLSEAVDILLQEGAYKRAMRLVEEQTWWDERPLIKVIEAVKESEPQWAFEQCRRKAEAIMDAGRSAEYDVAVEWLRRGRDVLLAAGLRQQWQAYLAGLLQKHERKYKLRPMLEALAV